MISVALVGHSNLPLFRSYSGVHLEFFKQGGAKLNDIWNPEKFDQRMLQRRWHIVIVFLGGNDLATCRNQDVIFERFMALVNAFRTRKLFITDLEKRWYRDPRQFGITSRDYNQLANIVNLRLKRYARRTRHFELVHVPPGYSTGSREGIHLGPLGEYMLVRKYRHKINEYVMEEYRRRVRQRFGDDE